VTGEAAAIDLLTFGARGNRQSDRDGVKVSHRHLLGGLPFLVMEETPR
jgi:hypothetical protein